MPGQPTDYGGLQIEGRLNAGGKPYPLFYIHLEFFKPVATRRRRWRATIRRSTVDARSLRRRFTVFIPCRYRPQAPQSL